MIFISQILITTRVILLVSVIVLLWLGAFVFLFYKISEYKRRLREEAEARKAEAESIAKKTLDMALDELAAIKQQVIIKARAEIQQAEHVATVTAILNRMKEHCPDCYAEVANDIKKAMRLNDLKTK